VTDLYPTIPLLDSVRRQLLSANLDKIKLVAVQHLFKTTVSLIQEILDSGISLNDCHVLGKAYSSIPSVCSALIKNGVIPAIPPLASPGLYKYSQRRFIKHWYDDICKSQKENQSLILLDEGGDLLRAVSSKTLHSSNVCGIEQTRFGLSAIAKTSFPVIQVADSAIKRHLEPPIITREIIRAFSRLSAGQSPRIGVIGIGSLGSCVASALRDAGKDVLVYDQSQVAVKNISQTSRLIKICESPKQMLRECDVILGCTGTDVFARIDWTRLGKLRTRHFISCSSGDYEFLSLLKRSVHSKPSSITDIEISICSKKAVIYNGGYPINFNRVSEFSPPGDIQLTRALLFGAVLQASELMRQGVKHVGGVMLCPKLQGFIARRWLKLCPERKKDYHRDILVGIGNIQWIAAHSGGRNTHVFETAGVRFD